MSFRQTLGILMAAFLPLTGWCAEPQTDYMALVKDIQMMSKVGERLTIVMWMPEQYWEASLGSNPRLTQVGKEEFLDAVRPYTIVAVVDAKVGITGALSFSETLAADVKLEDDAGNVYEPIDPQAQSGDIKNMLQTLKPVFANAMGPFGAHLEVLVFPANRKDGKRIADPIKDGFLVVRVADQRFRYRLPLGSLLPAMIDKRTGETFPGNYHFNPYTGDKLGLAPAAAK